MDIKNFASEYRVKPRLPEAWLSKKYKRSDRKVDNIILQRWQLEAHLRLRDVVQGFIQAFCGAGKTIAARSIAAYKIYKSGKMQIFCVPRNDIGNDGFSNYFNITIPLGKVNKILKCHAPTNFCDFKVIQKTDELIQLLVKSDLSQKGEDNITSSKQIVCTHQCLMAAFEKVKKMAKKDKSIMKRFIANKTFWIDEGHHIKSVQTEEEHRCMNLLGQFVKHILKNMDTGVEILAMTATPFRADNFSLFPENSLSNFEFYCLDFIDHFETLGIKNVKFDYEVYKDKKDMFRKVAQNIAKEITHKHFVFVPITKRKWRKDKQDVYALFDEIYKALMKALKINQETAKSMVLDLVTESTQDINDAKLKSEPKDGQTHKSKYTVVVACMKCREGSDWCPGDRIHNTAVEDSSTLTFQTNGRVFRRFAGKDTVKITFYVKPFSPAGKTKREFIADRVNYMLHYMLMDDLFNPILLDVPIFINSKDKDGLKTTGKKKNKLSDIFGLKCHVVKKELLKSFQDHNLNDENSNKLIMKAIKKHLPNIEKYSKKQISDIKLALKAFLLRSVSSNLRSKGIDISYIRKNGFDVIVEKEKISGNIYTSNLTTEEMQRFRDACRLKSWDDETNDRKHDYLIKYAEKTLGRRISKSRVLPNTNNPDYQAIQTIKDEHGKFKSFNDRINAVAKKKDIFSLKEIASSLKVTDNELRIRISRWSSGFLPTNWKDDLLHNSWHK